MYLKTFILVVVFVNFLAYGFSQKCITGNCKDGYGVARWDNGQTYTGLWSSGQPTFGVKVTAGGDKYIGQLNKSGESMASYVWKAGGTIRTTFINGKMNGIGAEVPNPDSVYVSRIANWQDGKILQVINRESGCISGDCNNGFGISISKDGSMYKGYWKNGKYEGKGILISGGMAMYVGSFVSSKSDGDGLTLFPSGNIYIGKYKNDEKNGLGTFYWASGTRYHGMWTNDTRNGEGTEYYKNGTSKSGTWNDNAYMEKEEEAGPMWTHGAGGTPDFGNLKTIIESQDNYVSGDGLEVKNISLWMAGCKLLYQVYLFDKKDRKSHTEKGIIDLASVKSIREEKDENAFYIITAEDKIPVACVSKRDTAIYLLEKLIKDCNPAYKKSK